MGGGGAGGGGPGRCCSCSIPNPAPTVSFGVCNYVRFFSVIVVPSHAPGPKRFVLSEPFR